MSHKNRPKPFVERMGNSFWQRLAHDNARFAVTDLDPRLGEGNPNILIVREAGRFVDRWSLPGGVFTRTVLGNSARGNKLGRRKFLGLPDFASNPSTDERITHDYNRLYEETGIDPQAVQWCGKLAAESATSGNDDTTEVNFGWLPGVRALSRPLASIDPHTRKAWVPVAEIAAIAADNTIHYPLAAAVVHIQSYAPPGTNGAQEQL